MNFNRIKRKIQKYTHKLKRSTIRNRANLYQQKLRYYHNLNKYGGNEGDNFYEDQIEKIKIKLETAEQLKKEGEEEKRKLEEEKEKCQIPCKIINVEKLEGLEKEKKKLEEVIDDDQKDSKKILAKIRDLKTEFAKMAREGGLTQSGGDNGSVANEITENLNTIKEKIEELKQKLEKCKQIQQQQTQSGGCGGACGLPLLPIYSDY